jgi:hypothetical protein
MRLGGQDCGRLGQQRVCFGDSQHGRRLIDVRLQLTKSVRSFGNRRSSHFSGNHHGCCDLLELKHIAGTDPWSDEIDRKFNVPKSILKAP